MLLTTIMRGTAAVIILSYALADRPTAFLSHPSATPKTAAHTISELGWIAGDWQTAAGGRSQSEEHWTQPNAGTMFAISRTIAGTRTVEFEFLRIEERAGDIFYVAQPKGRCPGTDFKLTTLTGQSAVFENPQHDFPKRIIYRRNADGSLTASIDGGEGTKAMAFPFQPMKK